MQVVLIRFYKNQVKSVGVMASVMKIDLNCMGRSAHLFQ